MIRSPSGEQIGLIAEPEDVQQRYFDVNVHRARISFDIAQLPAAIDETFRAHGWRAW